METNEIKEERETTNLVELFYSADQVRVAGGVLKVHIIWKKNREKVKTHVVHTGEHYLPFEHTS